MHILCAMVAPRLHYSRGIPALACETMSPKGSEGLFWFWWRAAPRILLEVESAGHDDTEDQKRRFRKKSSSFRGELRDSFESENIEEVHNKYFSMSREGRQGKVQGGMCK